MCDNGLDNIASKWWAYRHVSGHILVRHYDEPYGRDAIGDALDSDFVAEVYGPYTAKNRLEAEQIAVKELRRS